MPDEPVTIIKPQPEDYMMISKLCRKTFYDTWKHVNTEEDLRDYMEAHFNEQAVISELSQAEIFTFLIAMAGGKEAGYAKIRRDTSHTEFSKSEKAVELERLYLLTEYQGIKAGKALMQHCIDLLRAEQADWIWLGVNVDNHKAIAFYRHFGFEIFGKKIFYLGKAEDPDYLMKKRLKV